MVSPAAQTSSRALDFSKFLESNGTGVRVAAHSIPRKEQVAPHAAADNCASLEAQLSCYRAAVLQHIVLSTLAENAGRLDPTKRRLLLPLYARLYVQPSTVILKRFLLPLKLWNQKIQVGPHG